MNRFEEHFTGVFRERWPRLKEALLNDPVQGLFPNPFLPETPRIKNYETWDQGLKIKKPGEIFTPERDASGLLDIYVLDPASVFVAKSMGVNGGDAVLDMCAAPGGKSLVMSAALKESGTLISNDLSDDRRFRMKKIFDQYMPEYVRDRVKIHGWDAVQYGLKMPDTFDKVLLDAPCSGERHLMEHPKDLEEWKPKRSQSLAQRQYALLCAALLAVKPGGTVMYSTCSISPFENDDVIAKLLKKKGDTFKLMTLDDFKGAEKTEHGLRFLPDQCGFGPMYCCKIQRVSE